MNYYKPRQRKDGRWDFTCMNDGHAWPVGYCHEYKPLPRDIARMFATEEDVDQYMEDHEAKEHPYLHNYHGSGHATPEEASECYKKYLLDRELRLNQYHADKQEKCKVCGEWTQLSASMPGEMRDWVLCEKHNNREEVEKLFDSPCEIWSS